MTFIAASRVIPAARSSLLSRSVWPFRLASLLAVATVLLTSCGQVGSFSPASPDEAVSAPVGGVESSALDPSTPAQGGPARIALILPLSMNGGPSPVGASLRNAAELAASEAGGSDINLIVKDDQSTLDGARIAAQVATSEGAELIIGPLFGANVREVGRVASTMHVPVIGFSTDTNAAANNVYLLSFPAEGYVNRILEYAASRGKKSVGALIPNSDYGRVAEAEFQEVAGRLGLRVPVLEHYAPGAAAAVIAKMSASAAQMDALFIADQAEAMPALSQALEANNLDSRRVQILGTGLWNDARVLKLPGLQGAWFAGPDNTGYSAYADRYRAKFGSEPTRISTLAYDAMSLGIALARAQTTDRYAVSILTNETGFNGVDGVFRFRSNGQNERGLAVYSITNMLATPVSPAPRNFSNIVPMSAGN